jgi:hypothetical protein
VRGIALFAALILAGCARSSTPFTEDEVREFVKPGMPREAIIKRFGEPMHVEKNPRFEDGSDNVDEIIHYFLPLQDWNQHTGNHRFTGFDVGLKQGKVVNWQPSR